MTSHTPATFEQALDTRLRSDPGQPLVTFYDDSTGERTELSVTTYANWVAKTAGVLVEDLDLEPGSRLRLDLPTHWLGPVFLGAAWLAGVEVVSGDAAVTVVGPEGSADGSGVGEVLLCALDPFAGASRTPLPAGAVDFGTLWPGQPDTFLGRRAGAADPAYDGADQASLLARALGAVTEGERVLTDLDPSSTDGALLFVGSVLRGGSVVWVANPDPEGWASRAQSERAVAQPTRS